MPKSTDRPTDSSTAATNLFAQALSRGATKQVALTDEETAAFCTDVTTQKPATPELRKAAKRARRFTIVAR